MLNQENVGSDAWWQTVAQLGTPLLKTHDETPDKVTLTFLWRDKQGDESTSDTAAVYIDINGITDTLSFTPTTLTRLVGSDVWFWQITIEKGC